MEDLIVRDITELLEKWSPSAESSFALGTNKASLLASCKALWVEIHPAPAANADSCKVFLNTLEEAIWKELRDLVRSVDVTRDAHRLAVPGYPSLFLVVWPIRGVIQPVILAAVVETKWWEDSSEVTWLGSFHDLANMPPAHLLASLLLELEHRYEEELTRAQTHVEQLLNERIALKASHAEAVASVIEEREQRLAEQREHFQQIQTIIRKAADGIVTLDEQGAICSINEAAERIFGYSEEQLRGRPIDVLLSGEPGEAGQASTLLTSIRENLNVQGQTGEIKGRRRDGSDIELEPSLSEVQLGEERRYIVIFRDITLRKRLEEEQRQLHLMNQMILNAAGDGIVGVDHNGCITFVNPAAAKMLGWDAEELLGRPFFDTVCQNGGPGQACSCSEENHGARLKSADSPLIETLFARKDGSSFPVEYSSQPIREGDRITGQVITFRDISVRRMLEAKLRQAQKMESIGQLAAGIAHEINTPTQYIGDNICFVQEAFKELTPLLQACLQIRKRALAEDAISPEQLAAICDAVRNTDLEYLCEDIPRALAEAMDGVRGVSKIVKSMKEFSHPAAQAKQVVDFNRCVESTVTVCRNEWKYVADMELDLDPQLPPVYCSPGEMNQVLLNLIVNAAHAIGEKLSGVENGRGRIKVSTRCRDDWLEIRVSDTGTGIPESIRDRIFDPFFTTKPVGKGTGQGLAITHSIVVEKHGGTIDFETTPGEGTTFIVRIPIREPEREEKLLGSRAPAEDKAPDPNSGTGSGEESKVDSDGKKTV